MRKIEKLTHKKVSAAETVQESKIRISLSSTKSEINSTLDLFAKSTTISSLSIAQDTLDKKQLKLLCKGIAQNKATIRIVSIANISNEKPKEIAQIINSLTSCHRIKSLSINDVFAIDIRTSLSIILSNPYISKISLSFHKDRAQKTEEIKIAKTLVLCRYLTSAQICLSFSQEGYRALEIAYQYNQSLFSIQSLPGERLTFLQARQREVNKYISEWIKLQSNQPINCDITRLYNYAYNHYPIFKEKLEKHDKLNNTLFASSLLAALQPSDENMLCTKSLASVCKLFFSLIHQENTRLIEQDSSLCELPYDMLNHILTIAEQGITWRRDITDTRFNELVLPSV